MKQDVRAILDDRRRHRVLVVGDLMLDRYLWGEVDRISPEAPIPVLRTQAEEDRPGGAASVARNLAWLGCDVSVGGLVGADAEGTRLRALLDEAGVDAGLVGVEPSRPTILKCRHLARGQQVLRVDREQTTPLTPDLAEQLAARILPALAGVAAVILSDYGKGLLSDVLLPRLVAGAREAGIPVVVDPKRHDFGAYRGASLLTPNRGEAARATGREIPDVAAAAMAAQSLVEDHDLEAVALTLDRDGIVLARKGHDPLHLPTEPREVIDVTGAGDMVASVFAFALAGGHDLAAATALANIAGGLAVARVGVVSVSRLELRAAVSHVAGQHLRKLIDPQDFVAIRIDCRERGRRVALVTGAFADLRAADIEIMRHAKEAAEVLVIGLEAASEEDLAERARVLAALEDVDYIVRLEDARAFQETVSPDVLFQRKEGVRVPSATGDLADRVRAGGGIVLEV